MDAMTENNFVPMAAHSRDKGDYFKIAANRAVGGSATSRTGAASQNSYFGVRDIGTSDFRRWGVVWQQPKRSVVRDMQLQHAAYAATSADEKPQVCASGTTSSMERRNKRLMHPTLIQRPWLIGVKPSVRKRALGADDLLR
ncbi:hypothetical protein PSPO01_04990 [Paraphaeosphaeria sporulosa]